MALDTSRVLRVGVVWRGQVVAERVLDRRIDVSIGTRPDATVAVNPKEYPNFPAHIPLAVVHQNQYHLVLPTDPSHAIGLRGGPPGSQAVAKDQVVTVKGVRTVPVEAYTGGSITLGDIILMFQFVRGDAVPTVTKEETVLRIGLVHEDRLLSDQVFRGKKPIVIGVDPKFTIALPDVEYKGAPATFTPLGDGTKYRVRLPKGSQLRMAQDGAPMDEAELLGKKIATQAGDFVEFDLPLKARGRASLGPYTLLFQVIKQSLTVPAVPRKSVLAQIASPLLNDSTWSLSFLVAFLLIGSIVGQAILFHRTTGKFLGKTQTEEELASSIYEVLIEQKEEPKPEEPEKEAVDIKSDEAKKAEQKEIDKADKKKPEPKAEAKKPESTGKTVDPEEAKRQAREVVAKKTIAGALLGSGGAATKLFGAAGEGEEGTVVAKTFGGAGGGEEAAGPGAGGLKLAGGGGGGGTMEKVGGDGKKGFGERKSDETKVEAKKEEVKVNVKLSAGEMGGSGEAKTDVAKVISRKNSAVQRCYEQALRDNPDVGGKVKVSFTVGTAGTVTDVTVSGATGDFADCIKSKFMGIRGLPLLPAPQSFSQSYVFSKG